MVSWNASYHFIAVGGMGMSALAKILAEKGATVSGCDVQEQFMTKKDLQEHNVRVLVGQNASHLNGVDYAVFSSAIKPNNIEFQAAMEMHVPLLHRSEILSDLMDDKLSISVTGTHGKSSTTGFIAQGLDLIGFEPTFIGGAVVNALGGNAKLGNGPVVGEVDESDGSLLRIPSSIKVILNLDDDHLSFYGSMENLASTMQQYINGQPHSSIALLNYNDSLLKNMDPRSRKLYWYGYGAPDFCIDSIKLQGVHPIIDLKYNQQTFTILNNKIFGEHNGWNLGMAFSAMVMAGADPKRAADALQNVETPRRRQQILGTLGKTEIMVDIALHPTEFRALREVFEKNNMNVLLVFQPHRYSRYKLLFSDFVEELSKWPHVVITEIYPSDEPHEDISSYGMYEDVVTQEKYFIPDKEELFQFLPKILSNFDVVLFAGLGNIGNWAEDFFSINK
ncbi:UDP-N-acetylmuramate--L-alanine ligase [Coprothermobacter platensis]|uniref:UDP-N-acetylmuramate--L-alanine ligase n=1 Tax=Coprothermobacter platensis TaxID=108819 RepID=UPI000364A404|nr:Mur ligase domain-containing protein [Coprothermobacter platensis]